MSSKKIVERYTKISPTYKRRVSLINLFVLRKLRKKLIKMSGDNILEIAAGSGSNFRYYSNSQKITGIDLTPAMLELARKEAKKYKLEVNLKVANAENLPFKNKSFNTVIDTLGLCTYNDPIKALKEMKRVCKKDGKILLLEHGKSSSNIISKIQRLKEKYFYKNKCCEMTRDHKSLAALAGLNILHYERKLLGIIYFIAAKP